jgi:hypothetical protein
MQPQHLAPPRRRQFRRPMALRWLISTGVSQRPGRRQHLLAAPPSTPSPSWRMWTVSTVPEPRSGASAAISRAAGE